MKIIGLTGSIGMGKSVTASLLRRMGIKVHDSDAAVHHLLSPQGAAFESVARSFPSAWDAKTHQINRKKLGALVFADPQQKKRLEEILHPFVWQSQRQFLAKARRLRLKHVVLDIPLLFETGAEARCDHIICASAPYLVQRQRVLSRPGMTEERFQAILTQQIPDREKRRRASKVLQTGLGRRVTLRQLKAFLRKIKRAK